MKSVVVAASDHPFVVEVTVGIELAPKLLSDVSSMLDRSGLSRGEHWSLTAEYDKDIRLHFALSSRVFANLLRSAINVFMRRAHPVTTSAPARSAHAVTKATPAPLKFEAHGKVSGAFVHCTHVHIASKPKSPPQPQPVIEMPRDFQHLQEDVFHWG